MSLHNHASLLRSNLRWMLYNIRERNAARAWLYAGDAGYSAGQIVAICWRNLRRRVGL